MPMTLSYCRVLQLTDGSQASQHVFHSAFQLNILDVYYEAERSSQKCNKYAQYPSFSSPCPRDGRLSQISCIQYPCSQRQFFSMVSSSNLQCMFAR